MSQINRRDSLKSIAALGAAGTLGGWSALASAQAKPLTVGVIYVGPRDDYGYNQAHAQAAAEIKKLYGDKKLDSGKIKLDVPEIAENGLVVPVNVEVEFPFELNGKPKGIAKVDGIPTWKVTLPANGEATLNYAVKLR